MDARTLNAWTRFALQKGGIGTCVALIDNPANEAEDLMFMSGETITVLRKLDDHSESAQFSARSDNESFFLVSEMPYAHRVSHLQ